MESARTTLFAYFPAGIRANSAVRSSPNRNLREQRCLFNCRQELSKTWINYAERVSMPAVLVETTEFMSRTQRIKVWLNFVRAKPGDLRSRATAVFDGMKGNGGFPNPPFDLSKLGDQIDRYGQSVAVAMDGSKSARAEYKKQRQVLIDMLRELAHYVEANCKGSLELFRSSGFEPAPTERTQTAPLSKTIRSLGPGPNSGQVWLKLVASDDAYSYKARWAPWTEGEPEWSEIAIGHTRPATLITGLKSGTRYLF
jgi:hypothetical protein